MEKDGFFKEIGGKTIVEQIVDNITNAIIDGELKPGDKIPTETELSITMNVGRNSVREAIKILVAYGVLVIRRAEGTFVRQEFDKKMLYPVLYGIILQKDSANQIVELRKIMDVGILQLSMDKLDDAGLHAADQAMENLEIAVHGEHVTAHDIFEADVQFHRVLVDISKNNLLEGICYYVDKITKASRLRVCEKFLEDGEMEDFLFRHQEIVRILREKNHDAINEVVKHHYQHWVRMGEKRS